MWRDRFLCPLVLVCLVLMAAPGWCRVASGVVSVANRATISFPQAFPCPPAVVCTAQVNGQALIAGATAVTPTKFNVLVCDTAGNTPSGKVWVQWVAALHSQHVRVGRGMATHGQTITFALPSSSTPAPLWTTPAIVISGGLGAKPYIVGALHNSRTNFRVWFNDHAGSSAGTAWISWIAVVPHEKWRCGVRACPDGWNLSFTALPTVPTIVTSGAVGRTTTQGMSVIDVGVPFATCAVDNTASGARLSLRYHDNSAVTAAWVNWWALPAGHLIP